MNKSRPSTLKKQPKVNNKKPLQPQKTSKSKFSTKKSLKSPLSLSTPTSTTSLSSPFTTQQRNFITNNKFSSPLNTSFKTPSFLTPTIPTFNQSLTSSLPTHLRNTSKRGLIMKPKQPMDKEQDLFFEFNVLKEAKPIVELPDSEYPAWIWTVADPQKSLYEIGKIPDDELDTPTLRRKFKLERRELIRGNNNATRK